METFWSVQSAESFLVEVRHLLNQRFITLLGFTLPEPRRRLYRSLIADRLGEIAAIRVEKGHRLFPDLLFYLLHDEPFGEDTVEKVEKELRHIGFQTRYERNHRDAAEIATRLRLLHWKLAERLAAGETGMGLIASLYRRGTLANPRVSALERDLRGF